jgi:hypothetical protein
VADEVLYKPSRFGQLYHSLPHTEALGGGSAGPGKSLTLLMDPMYQVLVEHERCANQEHPHHIRWGESVGSAIHLRRTRPMLDDTIARSKRYFPAIDPDAKWDSQHTTWTFRSGYRLRFGHCRDTDDYQIYMSNEYTHVGFDELVQFEEDQYDQIAGRLRTTDPVLIKMLKVRSMTNPQMVSQSVKGEDFTVKNPFWVRERFVDPAPQGGVTLSKDLRLSSGKTVTHTRIYIKALLKDNPDPVFVERYEATLLNMKAHHRKALLDGDWYVQIGSYYGDVWNPNIHICRPFKIPSHWPQFRSMDWGFKKPGCIHWYALDDDDNLFVHREYTFKGKSAAEVAVDVKSIEQELGLWDEKTNRSKVTGPADTQLWEQRGDGVKGESKAREFARAGIQWVRANKTSRQRNAEIIYARLADSENETTTPGLVVFHNCRNLVRTVPAIKADPSNIDCPQDGGEDHWHDSLGYGCAFVSKGRAAIPQRSQKSDDDDEFEEEAPRRSKSWGYGG